MYRQKHAVFQHFSENRELGVLLIGIYALIWTTIMITLFQVSALFALPKSQIGYEIKSYKNMLSV